MFKKLAYLSLTIFFFLCISVTTAHAAEPDTSGLPLIYGNNYHIENGFRGFGGFLDIRQRFCRGVSPGNNLFCVSTSESEIRNVGSGTWKIEPENKAFEGSEVHSGQTVYLETQFEDPDSPGKSWGYLDTREMGCEENLYCVSTAPSERSRSANGSSKWRLTLVPTNSISSNAVIEEGQPVQLRNGFLGFTGGLLETKGRDCECNLYCVSTCSVDDTEKGTDKACLNRNNPNDSIESTYWTFLSAENTSPNQ